MDGEQELSIGEAVIKEFETPEETPKETPKETPVEWDKVERRKSYEGDKRRAADKVDPDPEQELDFEIEEGKGKAKLKTSELKDTAKWVHQNRQMLASMLKHREMATKFPEFGKAMNTLIEKSFNGNELNTEFVTKTLTALEGKVEKAEEKVEEKDALIDEMQAQLEDLDQDSPQANILKKSIAFQKGLKAEFSKQMAAGQKRIDAMEAKLNSVEKGQKDFYSEQEKTGQADEEKRLSRMYEKEIGALTSTDKQDGYKFTDEDERKEFDQAVRASVATNSANVKDDESFVKLIQASAKAAYEKMAQRRESWVNEYLKKKGELPKETPKKKEEKKETDPLEGKTIGEALAEAMAE